MLLLTWTSLVREDCRLHVPEDAAACLVNLPPEPKVLFMRLPETLYNSPRGVKCARPRGWGENG